MKKLLATILAVMLMLTAVVSLTACEDEKKSIFCGKTYVFQSSEIETEGFTPAELIQYATQIAQAKDEYNNYSLVFDSKELTYVFSRSGTTMNSGSYTVNDNTVELFKLDTGTGKEVSTGDVFTYANGQLTLVKTATQQGKTMTGTFVFAESK